MTTPSVFGDGGYINVTKTELELEQIHSHNFDTANLQSSLIFLVFVIMDNFSYHFQFAQITENQGTL